MRLRRPFLRISTCVQAADDDDLRRFYDIEEKIWESPEDCSANGPAHNRIQQRVRADVLNGYAERLQELVPKADLLPFVPCECIVDVLIGSTAKDDLHAHRRIRSRTSSHETPSAGFFS